MSLSLCPNCGRRRTTPQAQFCGKCGTKLPAPNRLLNSLSRVAKIGFRAFMAILLLAFLIGVVRGLEDKHSGDTSFGRPNFDAKSMPMVDNQGNPTGGHRMVLTLLDQETTRITRVVFNGRVSSEKCDFTGVAGAGIFAFANGSGFPCEAKPDDQGCEALDQSEL